MRHPIAYSGLAAMMLVWSAAATLPAFAQARKDDGRATAPDVYRIGPEDTLTISVWKNDALTRTVPVRPDGKISLPLLNDVQAAGLSAQELRDVLAQKLGAYMEAA